MSFEEAVNITVQPESVNVLLFANSSNITAFDEVKVSSVEAGSGIIFDATSSTVDRGVKIEEVRWDFGNGNKAVDQGGIALHQQKYDKGNYSISLEIETNQ